MPVAAMRLIFCGKPSNGLEVSEQVGCIKIAATLLQHVVCPDDFVKLDPARKGNSVIKSLPLKAPRNRERLIDVKDEVGPHVPKLPSKGDRKLFDLSRHHLPVGKHH